MSDYNKTIRVTSEKNIFDRYKNCNKPNLHFVTIKFRVISFCLPSILKSKFIDVTLVSTLVRKQCILFFSSLSNLFKTYPKKFLNAYIE